MIIINNIKFYNRNYIIDYVYFYNIKLELRVDREKNSIRQTIYLFKYYKDIYDFYSWRRDYKYYS